MRHVKLDYWLCDKGHYHRTQKTAQKCERGRISKEAKERQLVAQKLANPPKYLLQAGAIIEHGEFSGLREKTAAKLLKGGVTTKNQVLAMKGSEIISIRGISSDSLREIEIWLGRRTAAGTLLSYGPD